MLWGLFMLIRGQGHLLGDLPGFGVHGRRGSGLRLAGRLLVLGVDPDFADTRFGTDGRSRQEMS